MNFLTGGWENSQISYLENIADADNYATLNYDECGQATEVFLYIS